MLIQINQRTLCIIHQSNSNLKFEDPVFHLSLPILGSIKTKGFCFSKNPLCKTFSIKHPLHHPCYLTVVSLPFFIIFRLFLIFSYRQTLVNHFPVCQDVWSRQGPRREPVSRIRQNISKGRFLQNFLREFITNTDFLFSTEKPSLIFQLTLVSLQIPKFLGL